MPFPLPADGTPSCLPPGAEAVLERATPARSVGSEMSVAVPPPEEFDEAFLDNY